MTDTAQAAQAIAKFLQVFTTNGGMRLRFRVMVRAGAAATRTVHPDAVGALPEAERNLYVEFTGPDTPLLVARNGEVLNALEHIATKILRLEPEDHDRVSFDADHFKANRDRQLRELADSAIVRVQTSGQPYSFPAMSSRERRMLHLILGEAGLPTASSGEGPGRFVVVYPLGANTSAPYIPEAPTQRNGPRSVRNASGNR